MWHQTSIQTVRFPMRRLPQHSRGFCLSKMSGQACSGPEQRRPSFLCQNISPLEHVLNPLHRGSIHLEPQRFREATLSTQDLEHWHDVICCSKRERRNAVFDHGQCTMGLWTVMQLRAHVQGRRPCNDLYPLVAESHPEAGDVQHLCDED